MTSVRKHISIRRPYLVECSLVESQSEFAEPVWCPGTLDANSIESLYESTDGESTYVEMDSGARHLIKGPHSQHAHIMRGEGAIEK